jgi:hypothetical protein
MTNLTDRKDFYRHDDTPELLERTKNRLQTIQDKGMTEVGVAEFGINGVMSGLYIERVWRYSDEDFNGYMNWVDEMKAKKEVNV